MDIDRFIHKMEQNFSSLWIMGLVLGLGFMGVIIWAIIRIVLHVT